jgi:hypothetical protein
MSKVRLLLVTTATTAAFANGGIAFFLFERDVARR